MNIIITTILLMDSEKLRPSGRRRSNSPDSKSNNSRNNKTRDATMHSRSRIKESCPDLDFDKNQYILRKIILTLSKIRRSQEGEYFRYLWI